MADFGVAAQEGYHDGGAVPCGKHFPGHGDTHVDSYLDLPTVASGRERLEAVDFVPFRARLLVAEPPRRAAAKRIESSGDCIRLAMPEAVRPRAFASWADPRPSNPAVCRPSCVSRPAVV